MKLNSTLTLATLLSTIQANAALTIDITGTAGSNIVNYTASGSITVTSSIELKTTTVGAAPIGKTWDTGFDNNIGNIIKSGNSNQTSLVLSNAISYRINDVEFAKIEDFDLGADVLGTVNFLALNTNDIVSWSGSGTFTLSSGTFDTYFETNTSISSP